MALRLGPLWVTLGVALPLTFAGEMRPATMYLRVSECIPLYATEWLIFFLLGIVPCGIAVALDAAAGKIWPRVQHSMFSTAACAVVVSSALAIAVQTWIISLIGDVIPLPVWHGSLGAIVGIAAVCSALPIFRNILQRILYPARPVAVIGMATILTLGIGYHGTAQKLSNAPKATTIDSRPNIVLISVDALAANQMASFGGTRTTSPNIDALATTSIVYERFHADSNFTTPGVASLLTGVRPWTHRALQLQGWPSDLSVSNSLPALLHQSGYTTAYFPSNPWAGARRQGFSRYFDYVDTNLEWDTAPCFDLFSDRLPYLCAAASNPLINLSFKIATRAADLLGVLDTNRFADPARTVSAVNAWAGQQRTSPVFLWIHFFPPHDPYAAPIPWIGTFDASLLARSAATSHPQYLYRATLDSPDRIKTLEARYDESIGCVDNAIGQLLYDLRSTIGPNTAVILTADHGESFSHGYGGHGGIALYEDLIHIPLLISLPGELARQERRTELGDQADIAPTIAEIAHIQSPPTWTGTSLLAPALAEQPRTIFSMSFEQNRSLEPLRTGSVAVLRGKWKLVRYFGKARYPYAPELKSQLFDLTTDPHEQTNVLTNNQSIGDALAADIDAQLAQHGMDLTSE